MDQCLQKLNTFFESVPDAARRHRAAIWFCFILLSILIIAGSPRFKINMTMDAYFQEDDPIKQAYDQFKAQFGSDERLYIVYETKDKDIFSDRSLRTIKSLQDTLRNYQLNLPTGEPSPLDRITDVKTIVNASYIEAGDGDLVARQFIGDKLPKSEAERDSLRQQALQYPSYPLLYLSENAQLGGIMIRTNLGASIERDVYLDDREAIRYATAAETDLNSEAELDNETFEVDTDIVVETDLNTQPPAFEQAEIGDYTELMKSVQRILDQPEFSEHLIFHPVGNPPLMTYFDQILMKEMVLISGLCVLLIVIVLAILFRSLAAVVWPIVVVVLSLLWVIGLVGWSGATMTFMINIIVFLVLSVGVADAIHILSGYLFFRQQNQGHEQALRSVFQKSGLACFLTSVTTAIGLLALTLVPIVPVRNFGFFAALGVFFAFIFTVFVLPLMLDIWPPYSNRRALNQHLIQRGLQKVERLSYTYPRRIVFLFAAISALLVYGTLQIKVDSNFIEILRPDTLIRQDVDLVDEKMGGVQNGEILVNANHENALKDPRVLNRIEALQDYIEVTYPELVGLTNSIVDTTKSTFQALNGGRSDMFKIPQDARVLEQTLFLLNNANPNDQRLLVSDDYSRARITVTFKNAGSYVYVPVLDDIQARADKLFQPLRAVYPNMDVKITGNMSLMIRLIDYISWSQIKSFGLALIVISLLLLVVFGSKRIGFIAIFPNLFPILTAFGLMGFYGLPLDGDTLLVAPIIIGIAVDDTIHFLTHYRAGIYQYRHIPTTIQQSIREAGQAICFTSATLAVGFLVFLLSSHNGMRNFGVISAAAITVAVLADLLLLPALCTLFKADFRQPLEVAPSVQPSLA